MKNVIIYDATLRDGMQGIEVSYTLEDKIQIAHMLDDLNVDYIEGGFPRSNQKEAAFFSRVKDERFSHAKIVAFGSTRKAGHDAAEDSGINALLKTETDTVIVVGKAWKDHVKHVLKTDNSENLDMIAESVDYLKSCGREVFLDLEHFFDGYKDDHEYAVEILTRATQAGADTLILCDTNGGTLPHDVAAIMQDLPMDELAPLGVHFHNDSGTADANTLAGIRNGAMHAQGTVNGWGERCGNANLCVFVPNLCLKTRYSVNMGSQLEHLTSLSRFVAEKANIIPNKRQPYVGEAAFSHKGGQHADVISKADHLMEHIDSSLVGNERRIILSELAGKSTIVTKIARYGSYEKNSAVVARLLDILKEKERNGYEYEAAEASFDLIMRKCLDQYSPLFTLNNYHLESYKTGDLPSKTIGRIFLSHEQKQIMGAGVGVGPVETLDMCIRDALLPLNPFLSEIHLIDYRVRVLNPEAAAASKVRVFITSTDNERSWDTVGVSENIVEASWEAIVDSFEYYYNNYTLDDDSA
ncbi:MAG: citramalate synthase [Spirochaetales bacterium]|nr:citramalate synthase [Spirochaetales bacterium]